MPQVLTLDGVERELYPERAEFARRRGSRNRFRRGRKKGASLMGRTTTGKIARAAGAAAIGAAGALAARSRRGKNWTPVTDAKKLLGGAGTTGQRGGALTKTNIRGYDAGNGSLAGRRKLSIGDRAAGVGRRVRNKARNTANSVRSNVSSRNARRKQRRASKSY